MEQSNKRVRINVSTTAKGFCQWEATAEFESVEETKKNLADAITAAREVIKEQGLCEINICNN